MTIASIDSRILASQSDFENCVWPAVAGAFGNGSLIATEGKSDPVAKQLDYLGIDYLFVPAGGVPFGISQRVGRTAYTTVTFSERSLAQLRRVWGRPGGLAPAVHVQACVDCGSSGERSLRAVAVVKIDKLLSYADENPGACRTNQAQGTDFRAWEFLDLHEAGVLELMLPTPTLCNPLGLIS
jgi:hypothetical protein